MFGELAIKSKYLKFLFLRLLYTKKKEAEITDREYEAHKEAASKGCTFGPEATRTASKTQFQEDAYLGDSALVNTVKPGSEKVRLGDLPPPNRVFKFLKWMEDDHSNQFNRFSRSMPKVRRGPG